MNEQKKTHNLKQYYWRWNKMRGWRILLKKAVDIENQLTLNEWKWKDKKIRKFYKKKSFY